MNKQMPEQRVSDAQRLKPEWYKPMYDYLISRGVSLNDKQYTQENIDAANGIVSKKTFQQVLQPYSGIGSEALRDLPGEIRMTDFITPIREKNLGEYIELPYKFFVKVEDPDAILNRTLEIQNEVMAKMQSDFVELVTKVQEGGDPNAALPDYKEFADKFLNDFFDSKAIEGQHILNLINSLTDFDTERLQWFFNWWATEEFYVYRYIKNGELIKETIPPTKAYPISNGSQFVEDYDAFVWEVGLTFQQFMEQYGNDKNITKEDIDYLENIYIDRETGILSAPVEYLKNRFDIFNAGDHATENGRIQFPTTNQNMKMWNIVFKTVSEKKELIYMDTMGNINRAIVPLDYELNKLAGDLEIKSIWVPVVMIGKRFGDENLGIYFKPVEADVQRYDEVTNQCKLPVGGKKGLLDGIALNPIPRRLVPYLAIDRILLLQIERQIAKYQPYITAIPQSVINPDRSGTTLEKMQNIKADNTLIYDDTAIELQSVLQGLRTIGNYGLETYIKTLWDIRTENRQEAWDSANMNNERFGAAPASQTVSNANQNIYRAKLGSVLMVTMFNQALQREHIADLEFSKVAYINGKRGSYYDSGDGNYIDVSIDPVSHLNNKYGVFVVNSRVEESKLQEYKDFAFASAQNGDSDLAIAALDADHVPHIKRALTKANEAKKEYERWVQEQENVRTQATLEARTAEQDKIIAANKAIQDSKNETQLEIKYLDLKIQAMNNAQAPTNTEGVDDVDKTIEESKLRIQEAQLRLQEQSLNDGNALNKRQQDHKEFYDKEMIRLKEKDLQIKAKRPKPTNK